MPQNQKNSWIAYDFGNSAYALVVMTLFFPVYFTEIIGNSNHAISIYGASVAISILLVGILSPILGMQMDRKDVRVSYLRTFALVAIIATACLGIFSETSMLVTAFTFIIANTFFGLSLFAYDSLLIDSSENTKNLTQLSGAGWALGYIGGPLCLLLLLPVIGKIAPANSGEFQVTFIVTAIFFLVFALPTLVWLKEKKSTKKERAKITNPLLTIKQWRQHKQIFAFLIAMYFLSDGLVTIMYFVSIYGRDVLQLNLESIVLFIIYVQIVAIPATYLICKWANKNRELLVLSFCAIIWLVIVLGLFFASGKAMFYSIGALTGLVVGTTPAVARGYLGKIIPKEMRSEFFGFNSMAGRLASLIGPILFTIVAGLHSTRHAILTVIPFIAIAVFLLIRQQLKYQKS